MQTAANTAKAADHLKLRGLLSKTDSGATRGPSLYTLRKQLLVQRLNMVPALHDFVMDQIELDSIDAFKTEFLTEAEDDTLEQQEDDSLECFIGLPKLNNQRLLNTYLKKAYNKLEAGGHLIGRAATIGTQTDQQPNAKRKLAPELPYILAFVSGRVIPKLPFVRSLYFTVLSDKKRVLSKAEVLGRLYYSGFELQSVKHSEQELFFVAKKNGRPVQNSSPSEAFIIKLKRLGQNGKTIYIRKFRTMYPYSEYLQEYVYQQNKLNSNGKFKADFRITGWGKILRRFWIDELPQLFNLIKGDLRLVGVRALSEHYFSLYPKDLQTLRRNFKPGLIPPYYADLPTSFAEIIESERRYLKKKQAHPIKTDIEYFFRAGVNIVFRRARSN